MTDPCLYDDLGSDWTATNVATDDPLLGTYQVDGPIAARRILGTASPTGSTASHAVVFKDLSLNPNTVYVGVEGEWRFLYALRGGYPIADPDVKQEVKFRLSTMSSFVTVRIERDGVLFGTADDFVTVTCPSGVGGTFTVPRSLDASYVSIRVGTGTVTVTVQGISHTYSPAAMAPDPDSATATVVQTTNSDLVYTAESIFLGMDFFAASLTVMPWRCPESAPCGCLPFDPLDTIEPGKNQPIHDEHIGVGDGFTTVFETAWPFTVTSLQVEVDGIAVGADPDDPTTGAFVLSFAPATGDVITASYRRAAP